MQKVSRIAIKVGAVCALLCGIIILLGLGQPDRWTTGILCLMIGYLFLKAKITFEREKNEVSE